jgi:hypothetical protein
MQTDVLTAQLASVAARFPPSPKHALHLISWLRMLEKKGGYGSVQREISSLTPVDQPAALLPLQLMKYLLCAAPRRAHCFLLAGWPVDVSASRTSAGIFDRRLGPRLAQCGEKKVDSRRAIFSVGSGTLLRSSTGVKRV